MSFLDEINDISLFAWYISIFITIYSFTPTPKKNIITCHKKENLQDKNPPIESTKITINEDN
ncbi:hypothetical protein C0W35_21285 [Photobacterium kishitanii]|nr:hypothetical protein C0W35_21285 [Photobacterium kishitanii]